MKISAYKRSRAFDPIHTPDADTSAVVALVPLLEDTKFTVLLEASAILLT